MESGSGEGIREKMRKLKVHQGKRYLCWDDDRPFYYLGDTAWELFHQLKREEITKYLDVREQQGFTVIQAVALGEFEGLTKPNAYGFLPFAMRDGRPDLDRPVEEYWSHVDWAISEMGKRGLFAGLLPTWGDKFNQKWGVGPEVFLPDNARVYGEWIGRRYRKFWNVIWILGGDRPLENEEHRSVIDAMAQGIRSQDMDHLMTFHPCGATSSVDFVKGKDYIDFHMLQSGHGLEGLESYKLLERTRRAEKKPFLDGEPRYEDHPSCFRPQWRCYWNQEDVRQNLYWDMMEGACGHTYGNHGAWGFNKKVSDYYPVTWEEAMKRPGAEQIGFGKKLRLSRDYFSFRPAPELIEREKDQEERILEHQCAGRGKDYAYFYTPYGLPIKADLGAMGKCPLKLSWFDPRSGQEITEKVLPPKKVLLVPPTSGKGQDWIAVVEELKDI